MKTRGQKSEETQLKRYGKRKLRKMRSEAGKKAVQARMERIRLQNEAIEAEVDVSGMTRNERIFTYNMAGMTKAYLAQRENLSYPRIMQIVKQMELSTP